jgi:hypothetical protein
VFASEWLGADDCGAGVPDKALRQRDGGGMAPGVKLLASLLLGMLVAPAVTACGPFGSSSSPCDIVGTLDHEEIQITGPNVDGCGSEVHKEVSNLEFLGLLGETWQYGAPAPAGAPVCVVKSGGQTWSFYDTGSEDYTPAVCQLVKTKMGLRFVQKQLTQPAAGSPPPSPVSASGPLLR